MFKNVDLKLIDPYKISEIPIKENNFDKVIDDFNEFEDFETQNFNELEDNLLVSSENPVDKFTYDKNKIEKNVFLNSETNYSNNGEIPGLEINNKINIKDDYKFLNNFAYDQELKKNNSIDINIENLNSDINENKEINFSGKKNLESEKKNKSEEINFGEVIHLSTGTKFDFKKNNNIGNKTDEIIDFRCIYFLNFIVIGDNMLTTQKINKSNKIEEENIAYSVEERFDDKIFKNFTENNQNKKNLLTRNPPMKGNLLIIIF